MKIFSTLVFSFLLITCSLYAQYKGAFSDVYIYRSLFADIPDQVKTFKDSASFFFASSVSSSNITYDGSNRISGAETKTVVSSLFGSGNVVTITTTSSSNGNMLILENIIKSASSTSKTREVITYANDLPVQVVIDTLSATSVWKTKYKYTYDHQAGKVSNLKFYQLRRGLLSIFSDITFQFQNGKPYQYKTLSYESSLLTPDTLIGKYYFTNNKIDSVLEVYKDDGYRNAKFVPFYNALGKVEKVDKYTSFAGDLLGIGSVWFYGTSALAIMEEALVTQLRVANPVHGTINFIISSEHLNYDLLDGTGKRLLTSNTIEKTDVSSYSPGVYYLSFKGSYGIITKRIVIE